ncbi:MAG: protein kinase [Thermoanaerobaculales bacterium]
MSLQPGTRLGPYEILARLGEGGMGEVWRARDTRLGREVAIKALPETFADDPERLARFEREAKVLASLNHPNVATLHALEHVDGKQLLVMELVEGEGLDERIARGPMPIDEAIPVALQIAEGLEAAHERGIVHRDLKPGNVGVRPDGAVKVLDFGLAKAWEEQGPTPDLALSPTITGHHTRAGVILGTAAYMSPEQARGKPVDKRADIWAFGCLLYEMLTGKRLFAGETISDTLAAVLRQEVDWTALPSGLTSQVRTLLVRCLERDPKRRLRDIGEGRVALEEALAARRSPVSAGADAALAHEAAQRPPGLAAPASAPGMSGRWSRPKLSQWAPLVVATLLAAVFAALYLNSTRQHDANVGRAMRLEIVPPRGERLNLGLRPFAISPDGTTLAYVISKGATTELRVRSLDSGRFTQVPGAEGAQHPFFSPDGKWIAFQGGVKLKKVAVSGGSPVTLCDAPNFRGGVWAEDGSIYFVPTYYVPVARVSSVGGTPTSVTRIRSAEGEQQDRWPELLPGGRVLLYTVGSGGDWDDATIVAERLGSGERKVVVKGGTFPRYLPTGHLVYARAGALYAVPFNARSLEVEGAPVEVAGNVFVDASGYAAMDVSRTGMLVTAPAESVVGDLSLSWIDRAGRSEPLSLPRQFYASVALSPNGARVAVQISNAIATIDLGRLAVAKLTVSARGGTPIWSGDGRRLYFALEKGQHYQVFAKNADDSGSEQLVFPSDSGESPTQLSRDGTSILTIRTPPDGSNELLLRFVGAGAARSEPKLLVKSPFVDGPASLSPSGGLVAYEAEDTGRPEIYVRPASGEDRKWQVSTDGGTYPLWSPDGKEIFYLCGMKFMAVSVESQGEDIQVGTPRVLFENHEIYAYDVTRDGKRFLVAENPSPGTSSHLDVVVNWFLEVTRKVQEAKAP